MCIYAHQKQCKDFQNVDLCSASMKVLMKFLKMQY